MSLGVGSGVGVEVSVGSGVGVGVADGEVGITGTTGGTGFVVGAGFLFFFGLVPPSASDDPAGTDAVGCGVCCATPLSPSPESVALPVPRSAGAVVPVVG